MSKDKPRGDFGSDKLSLVGAPIISSVFSASWY
jgi:hypothetical protein